MAYYKKMENGTWKMTVDLGRDPITDKRKQATRSGFKRKQDAIDEADRLRREFKKKNPTSLDFEGLYKLWDESSDIRESTRIHRKAVYNAHILPFFGRKKINKVKPLDVENFITWLRQKGLSSNYIGLVKVYLGSMFNKAVDLELLERNPAKQVRVKKEKVKKIAWTVEESRRFLAYCMDHSAYYLAYFIALHGGLRIGEICALKWSDITDTDIHVSRTATRADGSRKHTGATKTYESERIVPLDETLETLFGKWRTDSEWVFPSKKAFIVPDTFRSDFKRLVKEIGLPDISFHDLRATHITMLLDAGVPVHTVSKRVGHADISMTLNRYSRVHQDKLRESSQRIDSLLNVVKTRGKDSDKH